MKRTQIGVALIACVFAASTVFGASREDLVHDWKMELKDGTVKFTSNHPAPFPFSTTGEPEALMTATTVKPSKEVPPLAYIVRSEIKDIREELEIAPYMEEDGHTPKGGIVSYYEEVEGQNIAFIKYRTVGEKGKQRVMPRTVRHAIFMKDDKIYYIHLIVLFAVHEEEVRGDQIRFIRNILRN